MHLEFLVEEPSAEAALQHIVPRITGHQHEAHFRVYQGKQDLLKRLPDRLRAYRQWILQNRRIVVLVDEDRQDCTQIKSDLEHIARQAGFSTQSAPNAASQFQVLNRVAVEELEAWFFGDIEALATAYPRVPRTLSTRRRFRNPDAISGGTWEQLERVLNKAGYYRAGMPKIEVASRIARHMDPARNRSTSFNTFVRGLRALIA
jgi:hypothetical protein